MKKIVFEIKGIFCPAGFKWIDKTICKKCSYCNKMHENCVECTYDEMLYP